MGLFDFLGGRSDFEEPYPQRQLKQRTDKSRSRFSDFLNQVIEKGKSLQDEPRLTAQDLFGDQMRRLGDSVRSSANATKQALSRAMIGGGGDVSGAAASNMLGVQETTNQDIGDIAMRFSQMADEVNRWRKRRGDRMTGQGLQGIQNLFQSDQNMLSGAMQRNIQRESARKQRGAGILGGLLNIGGQLGAAAICWVAEELYGKGSERAIIIRGFLLSHDGEDNKFGRFLEEYRKDGRKWALKVTEDESARLAAERLFDEFYKVAKAA